MNAANLRWAFSGLVAGQLVIFVLSLPGFGIETRKPSEYAAWAGPVFLVLTILVILFGIIVLATVRSRSAFAGRVGVGQALAAVATNLLDISHVGGPAPPPGPFALGSVSIVVAILTITIVALRMRAKTPPESSGPA